MTEHPITPPPELIHQWISDFYGNKIAPGEAVIDTATRAARWGADQELEACAEWIYKLLDRGLEWSMDLRAARRPQPMSKKERALKALSQMEDQLNAELVAEIRCALEELPDD